MGSCITINSNSNEKVEEIYFNRAKKLDDEILITHDLEEIDKINAKYGGQIMMVNDTEPIVNIALSPFNRWKSDIEYENCVCDFCLPFTNILNDPDFANKYNTSKDYFLSSKIKFHFTVTQQLSLLEYGSVDSFNSKSQFYIIPLDNFKVWGKFMKYEDITNQLTRVTIGDVVNKKIKFTVISHRWIDDSPDNEPNDLYNFSIGSIHGFLNDVDYVWLDYSCVPQDDVKFKAVQINLIAAIISLSTHVLPISLGDSDDLTRLWMITEASLAGRNRGEFASYIKVIGDSYATLSPNPSVPPKCYDKNDFIKVSDALVTSALQGYGFSKFGIQTYIYFISSFSANYGWHLILTESAERCPTMSRKRPIILDAGMIRVSTIGINGSAGIIHSYLATVV